ncbi:hypothetical protein [Pedobacter immunditicola]|uniref:baeRF3 domain-containing protein n=1 Tax=Pedobacter immunditicola TaxID=3133440 RepID=UPI0030987230
MNRFLTPEIKEIIETVHCRPSISLIMPFVAKINLETELSQSFKIAVDKVERELKNNYAEEISQLLIRKLNATIDKVDKKIPKKGVAIYVSSVFEKMVYLDVIVQERIVIDESFAIRDLIYSKKQCPKYLLLLLSAKRFSIYIGNLNQLTKIGASIPESIYAYINEWPEKVANFTDSNDRKQIVMQKFLQHIDTDLGRVIQEYQLPVFLMGTEKLLGHFKKISKHIDAIAGYINGNYDKMSFADLEEILKSNLEAWQGEKDKIAVNILDTAEGRNKLVKGIEPVLAAVTNNMGKKVFVESSFVDDNGVSYKRDAVDKIIEKVMVNGGDVDFVDAERLKNYEHIALVTY